MNKIINFQTHLLDWYKKEARSLPWRDDPSPYKVWISEIMLQQTRVDTVIPYFLRFIAEIPSVQALAEIEEEKLLKLWQGLGYYNRALNLKKAAQIIVQRFDGQLPSEVTALMSLPGIGSYTAGAIASIAFSKPAPAVDGNVLRIIARITASTEDIGDSKIKKEVEKFMMELLPFEHPGDFNQALMDLGATICIPKGEPKCPVCPINVFCEANNTGRTAEIPVKLIRNARKIEKKTVLVINCNQRYALKKRAEGGLLPNLWELPNVEGHLTKDQCSEFLNKMGIKTKKIEALQPAKHIFSHLEWHMVGYLVCTEEPLDSIDSSELVWATKKEMDHQYSIPTAFKDFAKICE